MYVVADHIDEASPAEYLNTSPALPMGDLAWQRIEGWIRYRYTPRTVIWFVNGSGYFEPNRLPYSITATEVWSNRAKEWESATLDPSPRGGFYLPCTGPWRITATVGGGSPAPVVPPLVLEAWKRLATYFAAAPGTPGATSESISAGSISIATRRSESWVSQAMVNSGAADLLRTFR
ncbi:hypothetical protein V4R08_04585 [Nitrobacter sp. NHB1]|uniref:hypothetical protein n=1 Tax=Nitrobacter sp. NHB1 TaxID=3119830 RepID=UPI002FFF57F9